jgi:hypothetical protein
LLQEASTHGHADANRDALTERPGGGFDAGCVTEFRVAGGWAVDLAEIF